MKEAAATALAAAVTEAWEDWAMEGAAVSEEEEKEVEVAVEEGAS